MDKIIDKYLEMSNAELRVKLVTLENEYEAIKVKLKDNIIRMEELNNEYISIKQVLNKRTRGIE